MKQWRSDCIDDNYSSEWREGYFEEETTFSVWFHPSVVIEELKIWAELYSGSQVTADLPWVCGTCEHTHITITILKIWMKGVPHK